MDVYILFEAKTDLIDNEGLWTSEANAKALVGSLDITHIRELEPGVAEIEYASILVGSKITTITPRKPGCQGCNHPKPDPHQERDGGLWCIADMAAAMAAGDDPRSVGPCF